MRNVTVKTVRIGTISATPLRLAPCITRFATILVQTLATYQERIAPRKAQSWNTVMGTRVGRDNKPCCNSPPNLQRTRCPARFVSRGIVTQLLTCSQWLVGNCERGYFLVGDRCRASSAWDRGTSARLQTRLAPIPGIPL